MRTKKIEELPVATVLADEDLLVINQDGVTKQVPLSVLCAHCGVEAEDESSSPSAGGESSSPSAGGESSSPSSSESESSSASESESSSASESESSSASESESVSGSSSASESESSSESSSSSSSESESSIDWRWSLHTAVMSATPEIQNFQSASVVQYAGNMQYPWTVLGGSPQGYDSYFESGCSGDYISCTDSGNFNGVSLNDVDVMGTGVSPITDYDGAYIHMGNDPDGNPYWQNDDEVDTRYIYAVDVPSFGCTP